MYGSRRITTENGIPFVGKDKFSENSIIDSVINHFHNTISDNVIGKNIERAKKLSKRGKRSVESTQEIGNKLYEILQGIEREREDDVYDRSDETGYRDRDRDSYDDYDESYESQDRGYEAGFEGRDGKKRGKTFVYVKPNSSKHSKARKRKLIFLGKIDKELQRRRDSEEKPEVQILLDAIRRASELLFNIDD